MAKALPKGRKVGKAINPYSGSGHQITYDESKVSPKSAAPNKYTTFATPKGTPSHVKVSPEYDYEFARMRATRRKKKK